MMPAHDKALGIAVAAVLVFLYAGPARCATPQAKTVDPEAARRAVLPQAACGLFVRTVHVAAAGDTLVYHRGYARPDTTGLVGYTVGARGRGYMSAIETMVGIDLGGRVVGTKVMSQAETPGLGDKIAEVKSAKTAAAALAALPAAVAASRKVVLPPEGSLAGAGCLVAGVRDAAAVADLERALGAGDTTAVAEIAPKALQLSGAAGQVLGDRAVAFAVSARVVESLRKDTLPWWQAQFVGRSSADLALSRTKTDGSIQAVTGATVSSRAFAESVRSAIVRLEKAVGGFKPVAGG